MTIKSYEEPKKTKKSSRKSKKDSVSIQISDEKVPLLSSAKKIEDSFIEDNGEGFNGASYTGAVFNLSTTIIGAGIMALPATMKVLGLPLGVCAIVIVAFLTDFSVDLLMRFSKASRSSSYGGVMGDAFGDIGKKILQFCVVVNNIGVLTVYMIILGDVLSGTTTSGIHHAGVLEGWFGEHWWTGRPFVLLVTTLAVFAPLASLKRIDSLKYTSAVAVALAIVFLVITAGITIAKFFNGGVIAPRLLPDVTDVNSIWTLFTVVPVLVTAYICHFNVHSIENELEDPSQITSVVRTSLTMCSIVYVMISIFGFLLFGDSTLDDVLSNFSTDLGIPFSSELNDIVRVSYALHLMLVFPIIFYPLRVNLDGLCFPSARPLVSSNWRFATLSIGLMSIVFIAAICVPSIWDAFQFTGATTAVCLGFIFPATIALRDARGIATNKDKIIPVFMIGIAVFASLVAIYSDAYAIFQRNASPSE